METPLNVNVVFLHFDYPIGLTGRLVQLAQLFKRMKYWQFSHVWITLSNGMQIEQTLGRTTIAFAAHSDHRGISVPLYTLLSNDVIVLNAYSYYSIYGEFNLDGSANCAAIVNKVLNLPLTNHYPATLYAYARLQTLLHSAQRNVDTPQNNSAITKRLND